MVYTIHHQKGGCGKTTTAQHLGRAWSERFKVLLVDFDSQANLSNVFALNDPKHDVARLLRRHIEDRPLDFAGMCKINENLDVLPSSRALINCLTMIEHFGGHRGSLLEDLLRRLGAASYDRIIIDTNPSDSWLSRNALAASDRIIVPVSCEAFAVDGLTSLKATLGELSRFQKRTLRVNHLIPTMMDGRRSEHRVYEEGLRGLYGGLVTEARIRVCSIIPRAQTRNLSVFDWGGPSRSAEDFRALAEELATESA